MSTIFEKIGICRKERNMIVIFSSHITHKAMIFITPVGGVIHELAVERNAEA